MVQIRKYRVGGHVMAVSLDSPWRFMEHTPAVAIRIAAAAAGDDPGVVPTRAGDEVPARTFVRSREELPEGRTRYDLDFSQYEPFRCGDEEDALFTLHVRGEEPQWLHSQMEDGTISLMMKVDTRPPYYYIYKRGEDTFYEFDADEGHIAGTLRVAGDLREGEYFPKEGFGPYTTMFQVSTALMMMFTYATAGLHTLLMHSSVIRYDGMASLFLGVSGTGKSTHSRLWLGNIEGCDLVNDDNPVLRVEDGAVYVYGSPWSGKTPCYRNLRVPVRAIVRLDQAPRNEIKRIQGLQAYASVIAAASSIRWMRSCMDNITATVEKVVSLTSCWHLDCTPDPEAAAVCFHAII